jgi:hypothetical protein
LVPSCLALACLSGCAPQDPGDDDEAIGIFGQAIKDGYADTKDHNVVGIYDLSIGAECSGSLIAPNVVLTARHCVSDTTEQVQCGKAKPGPLHAPKYFFVTTRPDLSSQNKADYHRVREVVGVPLDPKSNDPLVNKEDLCGRDQAMLILADNIAPTEATPWVPRVDSALEKGDEYYAIGFGATDDSGSSAGVRRRRDDLKVGCVGAECPAYAVKKTEFVGEAGICQGDSGGPALDMQNRVVGVTSRGSQGCMSPVYGHVFGWGQWIRDTVKRAASPGVGNYDAPEWAHGRSTAAEYNGPCGGACDAAECTSHVCVPASENPGNYCSRKCDALNTCPDGYDCNDSLGICTQRPPANLTSDPGVRPTSADAAGADSAEGASCSYSPDLDPTKPVPWKLGALFTAACFALGLRRRRRA